MGAAEELGELDASIARRIDEVVARKVEEIPLYQSAVDVDAHAG